MGNDSNCDCDCSECLIIGYPLPKKSKTSEVVINHHWNNLPSIVLHQIFNLLERHDKISASSVCYNWRHALFHPIYWHSATFQIDVYNNGELQDVMQTVASIVRNAIIKVDSFSSLCTSVLIAVLKCLSHNKNLRSLILEPTHCRLEHPPDLALTSLLSKCCTQPLEQFSIGGSEDLSQLVPDLLQMLIKQSPEKVTLLGLASVKEDFLNYSICDLQPSLITSFTNLKVLSVDYDIVCDGFLDALSYISSLERFIIHVHGVWPGHPGTTNRAWKQFTQANPKCMLRMSFIHAYDEVMKMHEYILREAMPLSHLRVFFCEYMNIQVLSALTSYYHNTLRSLVWVDSRGIDDKSTLQWSLTHQEEAVANEPDPLVMVAWLCPKLEEVVLLGYKYYEDDMVAICRLRNNTLKHFEVCMDDIIFSNQLAKLDPLKEVADVLGKSWHPLKKEELHPVILDPVKGDSDEYLLPIVQADLH